MGLFTKYLFYMMSPFLMASCIDYGPFEEEDFGYTDSDRGVYIVNEGNFMYGNASLSFYGSSTGEVQNDLFSRSNGISLGDVAQSMVINNGLGYITVNNSAIIFVIDPNTFKVKGTITGLLSPRNICFIDENKAYVSDLYQSALSILDIKTNKITGIIPTKGHPSTETMVLYGDKLFVNCWSNDNKVLVVDTKTDLIIDSILVAPQPRSMIKDKFGKIWVIADGSFNGENGGRNQPVLQKFDASTHIIESTFYLPSNSSPSNITINGALDTLYYFGSDVWRISVIDNQLPSLPFVVGNGTIIYDIAVDPLNSDLYVADAIDYVQPGVIYRYAANAAPIDTFRVGVIPGSLCFK